MTATVSPDDGAVRLTADLLNKMEIDRGAGNFTIGGQVLPVERINLTSMALSVDFAHNFMDALSNRSRIEMMGNSTKVELTAATHNLSVVGGAPIIVLRTGNVTVWISPPSDRPSLSPILDSFVAPEDNYSNLGPIGDVDFSGAATSEPINPQTQDPLTIPPSPKPTQPFDPFGELDKLTSAPEANAENPTSEFPNPSELLELGRTPDVPTPAELPIESTTMKMDEIPTPPLLGDQTTSSDFAIGQFGQTEFAEFPSTEKFPNPDLSFFATISSIDFATTTNSFAESTDEDSFPNAQPLINNARPPRSISNTIFMRLRVPKSVNQMSPKFVEDVESDLTQTVLKSVLVKSRRKRESGPNDIRIKLTDISRQGDDVVVKFRVIDLAENQTLDGPDIPEAMNAYGLDKLSELMHYEVLEVLPATSSDVFLISFVVLLAVFIFCCAILILEYKFSVWKRIRPNMNKIAA